MSLDVLAEKELATIAGHKIKDVKVEYYRIPLAEALADAKHGTHTDFELIVTRIYCADGTEGVGYTYTGGTGGRAIYSLVFDEYREWLIGRDASDVHEIWDAMQCKLHYVGRGGLVSFAASTIDIALWDIRCKRMGLPMWKVIGAHGNSTKCYAGGIDLNFTEDKLLQNIQGYLDRGFEAVKIKVGKPDYKEDVARVKAVRELIGPDKVFMVDANYSMTRETAIRFSRAIEQYDITWFEEPTLPDDFAGYAEIAQATNIPLAMGENLHTIHEFTHAVNYSKLGFLPSDASNIGGITGLMKVADLAYAHNLPVCTHGMQELHVSYLSALPHAGYLEVHSFPIEYYTTQPLRIVDGRAIAPNTPGTGVIFDESLISPHLVKSN